MRTGEDEAAGGEWEVEDYLKIRHRVGDADALLGECSVTINWARWSFDEEEEEDQQQQQQEKKKGKKEGQPFMVG